MEMSGDFRWGGQNSSSELTAVELRAEYLEGARISGGWQLRANVKSKLGLFKERRRGPLNSEQWGVPLSARYLLLCGEPLQFSDHWGGLGRPTLIELAMVPL